MIFWGFMKREEEKSKEFNFTIINKSIAISPVSSSIFDFEYIGLVLTYFFPYTSSIENEEQFFSYLK